MSNSVQQQKKVTLEKYFEENFPERPVEELNWKYQMRDMLDEWLVEFALIGLFSIIFFLGKGWDSWLKYVAILGWTGCGIYFIYLVGVIFLRRVCMKFHLTPDHFEYTHGLLSQKVETFQLSDIIEIDLRRSVWERLIHTGTIIIRFKNGSESPTNPLVIHGIGKYEEMFKKIDYYRNHHRLVLYFGI